MMKYGLLNIVTREHTAIHGYFRLLLLNQRSVRDIIDFTEESEQICHSLIWKSFLFAVFYNKYVTHMDDSLAYLLNSI